MNNENLNEILTKEELAKINDKLKKNENITLPENLSPENMAEKLQKVEQFIPGTEKITPKKRNKKKIIYRSLATAAAFVIAVTSVMIVKPWQKETPVKNNNPTQKPVKVQDYAEIEEMFAEYSENYKEYNKVSRIESAFDTLTSFGSKADSEIIMEDAMAQNSVQYSYSNSSNVSVGSASSNNTKAPTSPQAEATQKGDADDHGETNEQVKGVGEADIIKNDGKYLYVVNPDNADWATYYDELYSDLEKTTVTGGQTTPGYNPYAKTTQPVPESADETDKDDEETKTGKPELRYDCSVSIVAPESDGSMDKVVKFNIEKPEDKDIYYMSIFEMYVSGNKLIALVNCQKYNDEQPEDHLYKNGRSYYYGGRDLSLTMAVCFDISNRAEPVETWRVYQDGDYVSSRLIGNQLLMISNYYVDISCDEEQVKKTCVPQVGCDSVAMGRVDADCITVMENVYDSCYLVVSTLDTENKDTLKTQAVLGAGENVYCTTETLYATSTDYVYSDGVEEIFGSTSSKTQIYKFDIRNFDVRYLGCGAVEGSALNQFSMDEYNGYLRIATTSGDWGESLVNQLYVLDSDLNIVGSVTDIAKGETIKSVRFTGDTGYVVTFEQTDPLFVIDLSDPKKPEIKGELKIPGFSTYLHPVGENLVLGVGVDGDENGQNGGMKVSLFDVSNPEKPVECDKVTVNGVDSDYRWVYVNSAAYYTHKALCWDSSDNTMYIPYGKSESVIASYDGSDFYQKDVAGIRAVTVDVNNKKLSTSADYISNSTEYENSFEFTRATYINDVVFGYSDADNILTSFDKNTQKQLHSVKIR